MNTDFRISIPGSRRVLILSTTDIVFILRARRKTVTWLADEIGEKLSTTSMVLHGHRRSPVIRQKIHDAIAKLLAEMPAEQRRVLLNAA